MMWNKLIRWLAREQMAHLEYENKELRYELDRWRHRHEGAMDAVRVFEARYRYMENAFMDAAMLQPPAPIMLKK